MSSDDFHERPFDEGTLTKLDIFELYAREWLPVFLAKSEPRWTELHVFDFFAGPGVDVKGELGSPLRLMRQLREFQNLPGWSSVSVHAHFSDDAFDKIARLKTKVADQHRGIPDLKLDIQVREFSDALLRCASILRNPKAAKLLLIDQTGVINVTPQAFQTIVAAPTCDFLFFISSSTLLRFRDHPAIKQKIQIPDDYYHVHRAVVEYYRALLPDPAEYYLAPFSLKKGSNIYGLIFGSAHALGMDKFLQVAWSKDQINGEADFDIHRDNIEPGRPRLPFDDIGPTKLSAFEAELESRVRQQLVRDEREVIELCFRHGVKRQHAKKVLSALKHQGVIDISFSVPDIRNLRTPRPILTKK